MAWYDGVTLAEVDHEILPFWEGLKRHEFLLFRCKRCAACYWPAAYCRNHDDSPSLDEMEWVPTSGRGRVHASVVVHQVADQAYADELPYALAIVELEEGPVFPTRVIDCDVAAVRIGLPVEVAYRDVPANDITLPLFRPIPTPGPR
ncbi:MAG TPA: OB-fold domain-containing protein [Chloroflexota bacterium]|nr:OB-fold domain-containing protein [Chloroflexota bacterium]